MKKFFLFEIKYWLKQPMTWIFLLINTLLILGALTSDSIQIGGGNGNTHKNAPLAIEQYFAIMSLLGIVAITSFFNSTATRDYTYGMDQIVFATPIKKWHYFFGKFFGVFIIALVPYLGITIAAFIAPYMPWVDPLRYGDFNLPANIYGFVLFAVFNTLFGGAIIYSFALYFRNPVIAYLSSFAIIILYAISSTLTKDIENQSLVMLTDPIGMRAFSIYTKYWSPAQRNTGYIGFEGAFLVNRVLWAFISLSILSLIYKMYDFTKPKTIALKKEKLQNVKSVIYDKIPVAIISNKPLTSWLKQFVFELKSIVKNNSFIILTSIGIINLIVGLSFNSGTYGVKSLPVTYDMVDGIKNAMYLFVVAFMMFYSGYIVFREREVKFNEIIDATPVKNSVIVTTKIAAIIASLAVVFLVSIFIGLVTQLLNGYINFELDIYFKSLSIDLLSFGFLIIMSYLIQTLINNKYLAYFIIVVFNIANIFVWQALKVESNMVKFGGMPTVTYSDMNGFGPFIPGIIGFGIYWLSFCSLLIIVAIGMHIRGKETDFKQRLIQLKYYIKTHTVSTVSLLLIFILCGSWMYYNTKIKNSYISSKEIELRAVDYEKKYKKYEKMLLPFTTSISYSVDVFPDSRSMKVSLSWWIKNNNNTPVSELHYNMPAHAKNGKLSIPNGQLTTEDKELKYNIYKLSKSLLPNDSIELRYNADFINDGIENEVSFTELTQNGSFFHDYDIMPALGYNVNNEIADKSDRRNHGLPAKSRMAKLARNCTNVCNTSYISNNATWVNLITTISTSKSQIAVAPGTLIKKWQQGDRNYFTYQLKQASLNFFSFISADYLVKRDKINNIDVEIYYDKKHPYNIDKMTEAVKLSLKYYVENFGDYRHEQCRIIEYPRYSSYAQAFPGTMPYSESIGFITDLRDSSAIDLVTYVVSHEMGHQWWAHQVIGPAMQGSEMFSEGLAQYSALMVMEKRFGKDHMHRFLKYELDNYLSSRAVESEYENPLIRTEGQQYIHYNKASLVFYYLKEMIGEQKLNSALKNIVSKYAYQKPPFPTAFNVVDELKLATPDSLKYLITDMFENITLFNNRVDKVVVTETKDKKYNVKINLICEKLRGDSLGNEEMIPINDYINISLFAEKKDSDNSFGKIILSKQVKINQKETEYNFIVSEKPYQVGVDPYHYLIDKVISDNLKKVE
jgi:ABC-2 type transport system permease protein